MALTGWLLLQRAGDVEKNPGPQRCGWCQEPLAARFLTCGRCDTKFYMRKQCSGLTRTDAVQKWDSNSFVCNEWSSIEWRKCGMCNQTIKVTHKGVTCLSCQVECHWECANIPRSRRTQNPTRTCQECRGEPMEQ